MNLISVDCPNLQKALRFIHFPWSCPLQICISLYFLYDILKGAMIPGTNYKCLDGVVDVIFFFLDKRHYPNSFVFVTLLTYFKEDTFVYFFSYHKNVSPSIHEKYH